jgi:hypothetical protein
MRKNGKRKTGYVIPSHVDGCPVTQGSQDVTVVKGEEWLLLVPIDEEDDRLWEYSLTTGRIIKTR